MSYIGNEILDSEYYRVSDIGTYFLKKINRKIVKVIYFTKQNLSVGKPALSELYLFLKSFPLIIFYLLIIYKNT